LTKCKLSVARSLEPLAGLRKAFVMPSENKDRFQAVSEAAAKTVSLLELLAESLCSWVELYDDPIGFRDMGVDASKSCVGGYQALRSLVSSRLLSAVRGYAAGEGDPQIDAENVVWEAVALLDLISNRFAHIDGTDPVRVKGVRALALCVAREINTAFYAAWQDYINLRNARNALIR
jgi:hypothetical protein